MTIQQLISEYEEQLKKLWAEEVATTDLDPGYDHYLTMSEDIDGQRFPILVGVGGNGIADGEIISNGFFEEIVGEGGLNFGIEVPDNVRSEIADINHEASFA